MRGKVIAFPARQSKWTVRFKTPIRMKVGILPFLVKFGSVSTATVQAESLKQAKYIVQQHLPIDEWIE